MYIIWTAKRVKFVAKQRVDGLYANTYVETGLDRGPPGTSASMHPWIYSCTHAAHQAQGKNRHKSQQEQAPAGGILARFTRAVSAPVQAFRRTLSAPSPPPAPAPAPASSPATKPVTRASQSAPAPAPALAPAPAAATAGRESDEHARWSLAQCQTQDGAPGGRGSGSVSGGALRFERAASAPAPSSSYSNL